MSDYLIPSYWKSVNLGDPKLREFFTDADGWVVEEKIDGSQLSWASVHGQLYMRSKGKHLDLNDPEKMFSTAVESIKDLHARGYLYDNTIYRGEAVTSPKHNTLLYSRTPEHYVVLYGMEDAVSGESLSREKLEVLGARSGFEVTPCYSTFRGSGAELFSTLESYLDRQAMLGGALIEGVVVKRMGRQVYFMDRPIFAKLVSSAFREQHKSSWKESNPGKEDIIQRLILELSGPARYQKAVQRLREQGGFTESVKDIGNIIKEVKKDVVEEGEAHAKEALWNWAKEKLARAAGAGVPEWWKRQLMDTLQEDLNEVPNECSSA